MTTTIRRDRLRIKHELQWAMEIEETHNDPHNAAIARDILSRRDVSIFFASCTDQHRGERRPGHFAGYLAYSIPYRDTAVVARLCVAADHQRRGWGKELVRQLQEYAEESGLYVQAFVNDDRLDMHRLLRGRTFACNGISYGPRTFYCFTWPRPEPLDFKVIHGGNP